VGYIVLPIRRDPVEAEEQSFEVVRGQWSDWEASDGDPFTILLRASAVMYADLTEAATQMGEEGLRYFGRSVANVPPIDDTLATGTVTFTAQDTNGPYAIPEGLEIAGSGPTGDLVGFHTLEAASIPNGSLTLSVPVEAILPGTDGNGISGTGELTEFLDYLVGVAFDAPTDGAVDREADETYLDRLSEELQLSSPRPILTRDFATLAMRFAGEGSRATAINGLDPTDGTTGHGKTVAVAIAKPDGTAYSTPEMTAVSDALEAMREPNFSVPVFAPTQNRIQVTGTATAYPDWNAADVQAQANAQIENYLSGANWGRREDTGQGISREWLNEPLVRYLELAEQLQRIEGLRYVDTLQLRAFGGSYGSADVAMTGYAPLPYTLPGDVTIVVSAG
jgi:hypothetical protein